MDVKLLEVAGMNPSIKAMRLPKYSNDKSDSFPVLLGTIVGEKDMKLSQKLILVGDEHAKHMRGVLVWLDITAPDYWWDEASTYEVGVIKLPSSSTMHGEFKNLTDEELEKARSEQKRGVEYRRIWVFSYQTLRRIYFQRKSHRLRQWKQFCQFIETLPLAKELIMIEKEREYVVVDNTQFNSDFHNN